MIKEILKESFKITWHRPGLWLWGFLTTLLFFSINDLAFVFISPGIFLNFAGLESFTFLGESSMSIPFLSIVVISFTILLISLSATLAEIIIILNIKKSVFGDQKIKGEPKRIWPVLGFRFSEAFLLFVIWSPTFIFLNKISYSFAFLLIFLSASFSLLVLFIARYAIFHVLIKKNYFIQGIKNAVLFFGKNWLQTIKISFLLFIIVFIYSLLVFSFLEGGVFTYPLRLVNFLLTAILGTSGFWLSFIVTAILILLLQVILVGFIAAYQITSWVLFFFKMGGQTVDENPRKNFSEI